MTGNEGSTKAGIDRRSLLAAGAAMGAALVAPVSARAADPIEIVEGGAGGGPEVAIEKMAFQTPEVKVKVGDAVTWRNNDDIAHNVHFRQGPAKGHPKAQGKMLNKGDAHTVKFGAAGEYAYICTPHPMMKGKVIVEG